MVGHWSTVDNKNVYLHPIETMEHLLVFTDLDGTLLDHDTYSFTDARSILELLRLKSIPVIPCTSKTRSETEKIRHNMGLEAPFIVENGSAIFVPKEQLDCTESGFFEQENYMLKEFGTPYETLRTIWKTTKSRHGLRMKGFSEMSLEEISSLTGLPREEARLSAQREYSEPFLYQDRPEALPHLKEQFENVGLQVTRGGRFYHLIGQNDKGKAVQVLKKVYGKTYPSKTFISVGLGDSKNDIPMLENVDIPVVIRKKHGDWEPVGDIPGIVYSQNPGPTGWAEVISRLLS